MEDIWFWLIIAFLIAGYSVVEYLFFDGIFRTGVNAFVWMAQKIKILRPEPNQLDLNELNQKSHKIKKKSHASNKRI